MSVHWRRSLPAGAAVSLQATLGSAEIRSCCLVSGESSTLYCAAENGQRYAVGHLTSGSPHCSLKLLLPKDAIVSCTAGELMICGVADSDMQVETWLQFSCY
ncbi:unnamed protein product [Polarella glacialis]|uniref:Uncharacterized protein n=1 Tax=Polarella glacialis TaxID=89957 RepID=A0A813EX04_POLGL|nr:unnamed protein product [Polarella glacialis]